MDSRKYYYGTFICGKTYRQKILIHLSCLLETILRKSNQAVKIEHSDEPGRNFHRETILVKS